MLQINTVTVAALKLLKKLMVHKSLKEFSLAGGTGLALRIGRRISDDLDLFCLNDFSEEQILQDLKSDFSIQLNNISRNTLNLEIDDIKVDILSYKYPLLEEIEIIENIRFLSIKDIAAMKLSAISSRGCKKDFYDLYFILKDYTLNELLEFYKIKFKTDQFYHILKSLVFFDDAELEPDPLLLDKDITWEFVKTTFEKTVNDFIRQ